MAARARIIVEESPMGAFMRDLPNTLLNLYSLNQQIARDAYENQEQRDWQAGQAELTRDFQIQQTQLGIAADEYRSLRERKYALEDELKGYKLPYEQTKPGSILIDATKGGIDQGIVDTEDKIYSLMGSLEIISSGVDFAKGKADQYGALIEASKDEKWRDKLLEGDITVDKDGELVGSGEMFEFLKELKTKSPESYDQLKNANFRKSFMASIRTAEEAMNLQASEQQLVTIALQQEAAQTAIDQGNFKLFQAKHEEAETNFHEIYKHQALTMTSQFRYGQYSMMDLVALGADNPQKLIDIKEEFRKAHPDIAHDADKFLSGIQNAQANKLDASKFVVNFYAKAYEDYLELDEFKEELAKEGRVVGMKYGEMYKTLGAKNPTKIEIDRLTKKVAGFKLLGMYREGADALNHMYAVTKMHDEQQARRLSADVKEHEQVSGYGLELGDLQDYYPDQFQYMEPEERIELEKSLAFISASGSSPIPVDDNASIESLIANIQQTELAQEGEQATYDTLRLEYKYALSDLKGGHQSQQVFQATIDKMYKAGMIQGTKGPYAGRPYISEGYHFTQEEMEVIKTEIKKRARRWRKGSGGLFGRSAADAIKLLKQYQRFENAWKAFDPVWQGRKNDRIKILDELKGI